LTRQQPAELVDALPDGLSGRWSAISEQVTGHGALQDTRCRVAGDARLEAGAPAT